MDAFLQSQIEIVVAFQKIGGLEGLMKGFTFLGSEEFFLVLLPLVYLCIDAGVGARLAFVLLLSDSINALLKIAFHLPRPYWFDPQRVKGLAEETSYGLPSGHAQNATSVWVFLASAMKKPWAWAGAAVIAFLISISRVYLGVHFPMDIAAGWVISGAFLAAYLWVEPGAKGWLSSLGMWGQIGVVSGAAAIIVVAGFIVRAAVAGVADPAAWAEFAKEARLLNGVVTDAGAIFGVGVGLAMASRWARFNAGGPLGKRVARFGIGLVGVGVVWIGLRVIFPREPEAIGLFFRFVRYALATWWAIFLAPWVFLKMKLVEPI
ncbi:MAG TPA: phosphatase PAP2 family protein [Anaerolineales bacterium]|nr:phosphatase PAP2 family protein [Anaerolineales bacterium]